MQPRVMQHPRASRITRAISHVKSETSCHCRGASKEHITHRARLCVFYCFAFLQIVSLFSTHAPTHLTPTGLPGKSRFFFFLPVSAQPSSTARVHMRHRRILDVHKYNNLDSQPPHRANTARPSKAAKAQKIERKKKITTGWRFIKVVSGWHSPVSQNLWQVHPVSH